MRATRVHLVRHGEVDNPGGVLYGRLPGFGLSERGHRMAALAAADLERELAGVDPAGIRLVVSPLQRTRESAAPIAAALGLEPIVDERVIEPWNRFEGTVMRRALRDPRNWPLLRSPALPSWGEPFAGIVARMRAAIDEHAEAAPGADVIVVTHQLPIWMVHRAATNQALAHNPAKRRCALSSVTVVERHPATGLTEVRYREPAASELADAIDQGAV